MPQVGPLEILIVAAIALIVFGPQKLPEIARTVGRFLNQLRSMANEVKSEFSAGMDDDEVADEVTVEPPEDTATATADDETKDRGEERDERTAS